MGSKKLTGSIGLIGLLFFLLNATNPKIHELEDKVDMMEGVLAAIEKKQKMLQKKLPQLTGTETQATDKNEKQSAP